MIIDLEQVKAFIAATDADTRKAVSSAIASTEAAIIEERNAALPEWVSLTALAGAKGQVEVTKAQAIAALQAGTHVIQGC
jgi:hypothetical protein